MRKLLFLLAVVCSPNLMAQDLIYLECTITGPYNVGETRDWLLDKRSKTITQIINGLSTDAQDRLERDYRETTTQYVVDRILAINKFTLKFQTPQFDDIPGMEGQCAIREEQI